MFQHSIRFLAVSSVAILMVTMVFGLAAADAARFNRGRNYQPHHGQSRYNQSQAQYLRETAQDRRNGFRNHGADYHRGYRNRSYRSQYRQQNRYGNHNVYRNQYQFQRPTTIHPGARLQGPRPSYGIQVRY